MDQGGQASAEAEAGLADRPDQAELRLWERWRLHGDYAAREQLVLRHLGFARMMAGKVYRGRYNDEFDFSEYMQFATVGLLESIDRFDPATGVTFRTFAAKRMAGAILDGVQHLSEQQQQINARQRIVRERAQSMDALADSGTVSDVFDRLAQVAIGLALGYMLEGSSMYAGDEPATADNCYTRVELKQLQGQVRAMVESLPEREKLIVKEHYLNRLPFDTIADILNVSKGRVSQLHRRALVMLRDACKKINDCDLTW